MCCIVFLLVVMAATCCAEPSSGIMRYEDFAIHEVSAKLPVTEPPSVPDVMRAYGLSCIQEKSCEFYQDILLVVKLNPVRLLWADILLNFYATGFKNIVFYSSLRKNDQAVTKYLVVGERQIKVHLVDDNYGFCDHFTVALAMERWPGYTGYIYLSDDVWFPYWTTVGTEKSKVWRQQLEKVDTNRLTVKEKDAIKEILTTIPSLSGRVSVRNPPFASTSGLYYVPSTTKNVFGTVSRILLKHRTYNEWGTPIVLNCVDNGDAVILRGKLVWGNKRLLVRKYFFGKAYTWYHPIRATGEFFSRILHHVYTSKTSIAKDHKIDDALFNATCLDCATYPVPQRKMKGLYHSCIHLEPDVEGKCKNKAIGEYAPPHWPIFRDARLVGGRVFVAPQRDKVVNPLELRHEGFWGKEITIYVFEEYYPKLNVTGQQCRLLKAYPECCRV